VGHCLHRTWETIEKSPKEIIFTINLRIFEKANDLIIIETNVEKKKYKYNINGAIPRGAVTKLFPISAYFLIFHTSN
jgi:hypothetical protein